VPPQLADKLDNKHTHTATPAARYSNGYSDKYLEVFLIHVLLMLRNYAI